MKRATDVVAIGGVTLPAWWPSLEQTGDGASDLLPILSALWLAVQIGRFVWQWRRDAR